jgi:Rrf2 family protein
MQALLSQTAEYALRATSWMAVNAPDEPVRAKDLSLATGIPEHYLAKILRRLVLGGVLESRKGQGGGFAFTRSLAQIRFRDVLAAVDVAPTPDRCAFGWGTCDAQRPCPLHPVWTRMADEFATWASSTTLAEVRRIGRSPRARRRR